MAYRRLAHRARFLPPDCLTCLFVSANATIGIHLTVATVVTVRVVTYLDSMDLVTRLEILSCLRKRIAIFALRMELKSSSTFDCCGSIFVQRGKEFAFSSIVPIHPGGARVARSAVI